jgi:hypothetical protein
MRLQAALYLSALLAVVNWSVFIYVQWYLPRLGDGSAIYAAGATLVLVGLWLQSRMARYVGAAFFLAGVAVYALWGAKQVNVGVVWAATMAVLSLAPHRSSFSQGRSQEHSRLRARSDLHTRSISYTHSPS